MLIEAIKIDNVAITRDAPKQGNPDRFYRVEAMSGCMDWFTREELLEWRDTVVRAVNLMVGGE